MWWSKKSVALRGLLKRQECMGRKIEHRKTKLLRSVYSCKQGAFKVTDSLSILLDTLGLCSYKPIWTINSTPSLLFHAKNGASTLLSNTSNICQTSWSHIQKNSKLHREHRVTTKFILHAMTLVYSTEIYYPVWILQSGNWTRILRKKCDVTQKVVDASLK